MQQAINMAILHAGWTKPLLVQKDEKIYSIYIIIRAGDIDGPDHLLREQQRRK